MPKLKAKRVIVTFVALVEQSLDEDKEKGQAWAQFVEACAKGKLAKENITIEDM